MKGSINRSKNCVTSNIKLPTIHFSGRFGKEYRIIVFFPGVKRKSGNHGVLLKMRCKSATAYKDCLREIQMLGCGYGAPVFSRTMKTNTPMKTGCVRQAVHQTEHCTLFAIKKEWRGWKGVASSGVKEKM